MKKIGLCLLVLLLVGGTITSAAEDETMIIFSGTSKEFIAPKGEWVDFRMMDPGESRTQTLVLENTDNKPMDFYMSVDILENISQTAPGENARYEIKVTSGKEVLLEEQIDASEPSGDSKLGKEWKLDTLNKDEKKQVNLTLTLNGESMGNAYQGQKGKIQIIFATEDHSGEKQEGPVILRTDGGAKTSDSVAWSVMAFLGILFVVSGISIVVLLVKGKILGRKAR